MGAGSTATTGSASADVSLGSLALTFAPGETVQKVSLSALVDTLSELPEVLVLKLLAATGARVDGPAEHRVAISDGAAPSVTSPSTALAVSAAASVGSLVTDLDATPAAGRLVQSWEILAGNPVLQGSPTPAFSIDSQGRLTLSNPAALPVGAHQLRLAIKATDDQGSASVAHVEINTGGVAGALPVSSDAPLTAYTGRGLSQFSLTPVAYTDGGTAPSVWNGEITRDATLGLKGTADAGALVKVYAGDVFLGQVTAGDDNTWGMATPSLANGQHILRAVVTNSDGFVATTEALTVEVPVAFWWTTPLSCLVTCHQP